MDSPLFLNRKYIFKGSVFHCYASLLESTMISWARKKNEFFFPTDGENFTSSRCFFNGLNGRQLTYGIDRQKTRHPINCIGFLCIHSKQVIFRLSSIKQYRSLCHLVFHHPKCWLNTKGSAPTCNSIDWSPIHGPKIMDVEFHTFSFPHQAIHLKPLFDWRIGS